jgi:adenosylmethionine-8-amino-7-oxononanoate aminotransferase
MQEPYNISLYPGTGSVDGTYGDHILISPPYNVTQDDIELIIEVTGKVIEDFFTDMKLAV